MRRIIFIPFLPGQQAEFLAKSRQWQEARPDKNYEIVVYDPAHPEVAEAALRNLGPDTQIYLRGHGFPGTGQVATKLDGTDEGVSISIEQSINRLVDSAPPDTFRDFKGKIKFYSCYSSLRGTPKHTDAYGRERGLDDPRPTAEKGKEYFKSLYPQSRAKFYGYRGPLASEYSRRDDGGRVYSRPHKFVQQLVENVERYESEAGHEADIGVWTKGGFRSGRRTAAQRVLRLQGSLLNAEFTRASRGRTRHR